jgi:hypothetical protein
MSDSVTATPEYNDLLDSIKRTLADGRLRAARAVNNVIIETYWEIGHDIIRRQQEQGWGAQVIKRLSNLNCAAEPRTCARPSGVFRKALPG